MVFKTDPGSAHKEQDYAKFREFLEKICGIVLGENKNYLIDSRLRKVMFDNGLDCLSDLVRKINGVGSSKLRQDVIDVMN